MAVKRWIGIGLLVAVGLVVSIGVAHLRAGLWALAEYARPPERLIVPVWGVQPGALTGTFGAPRSEGRRHEGIDIFARRGTPVVSAVAGRVSRIGQNRLGGNVVWIAGEGASMYYYAHLDTFRDGLEVGDEVHAGQVVGYVGTSGNALHTPPHLHFGIYPALNLLRAIDPYPVLRLRGRPTVVVSTSRATRPGG